jgi:hypothetical protein
MMPVIQQLLQLRDVYVLAILGAYQALHSTYILQLCELWHLFA